MEQDFCEYCNGTLPNEEKSVTVYRHKGGNHYIFEHVPARVCHHCGERYFSIGAVRQMEGKMSEIPPPSVLVPVPVIELQSV